MNTRADLLAWKRQQLIAESTAQRAELAVQMRSFTHTLASVQIGLRIVDRLRRHPGWVAALPLVLAALTPRRLSSFFRLGTMSLRFWRLVSPTLRLLTNQK